MVDDEGPDRESAQLHVVGTPFVDVEGVGDVVELTGNLRGPSTDPRAASGRTPQRGPFGGRFGRVPTPYEHRRQIHAVVGVQVAEHDRDLAWVDDPLQFTEGTGAALHDHRLMSGKLQKVPRACSTGATHTP